MHFVTVLLLIIEVLCSLMLIGLILLQKSKSDGLGMAFGGGAGEALFGGRAGNVLTKMTVWVAGIFLGCTLLLAISYAGKEDKSLVEQSISEMPAASQAVDSTTSIVPPAATEAIPPAAK